MVSFSTLLLAVSVPALVLGHSWIACTDYSGDVFADRGYVPSKCSGFARDWTSNGGRTPFGVDFNQFNTFDFRGGRNPSQAVCKAGRGTGYPGEFPAANYRQGERVRIVWPGKNHGGSGNGQCKDDVSDRQDLIFAYCDGRDPSFGELRNRNNGHLVADLKANGGRGFKNCYNYCADTDKSPCQADFTVPRNLNGRCTFIWFWEQNPEEFYTSCWEANVSGGSGSAPAPRPNPAPAPAPGPAPSGGRFVRLHRSPQPIPVNGAFDIEVQWSLGSSASRTLLVDVQSTDFGTFYGKGFQHQNAASNTNRLQIQLSRQIPEGQEVVLKMYLVDRAVYDRDPSNAWRNDLVEGFGRVRASSSGRRTL